MSYAPNTTNRAHTSNQDKRRSNRTIHPDFGKSIGFVAGGIGDQIYHLTQLRALASVSTGGVIDIACIHPKQIYALLASTPWVGQIIDARPMRRYVPGLRARAPVKMLRQGGYNTGFFMHYSTSFKLAATFAGIKNRIGLADSRLDRFLVQRALGDESESGIGMARRDVWGHRPFIAAIDEFITQLDLVLDEDSPTIIPSNAAMDSGRDFINSMTGSKNGPTVILNLFALDEARRWPIPAAIEVVANLAAKTGGRFILNAGPDAVDCHKSAISAWQARCKNDKSIRPDQLVDSLKDGASMERDAALYHLADAYLGVDSFTANLAMNCNLPAVIMFASARDRLAYRSIVEPVIAMQAGNLASVPAADIIAAFERLPPDKSY